MRVAYVTMGFPVPSETFISNEVRVLHESGIDISVHAFRAALQVASQLVAERSLEGIRTTHGGIVPTVQGLSIGFLRPGMLLRLVVFVLRHAWRRPEHVVKSLLLIPRALHIFSTLQHYRPDVLHLSWGHYPSLVGYLIQVYRPDTVVSISLGRYDLEMEYGGSAPVAQKADMIRSLARVNVQHIAGSYGVPPERVRVLYDGVELSRDRGAEAADAKIRRRIVTAGRLLPLKGMRDVLRVVANIRERWPDTSLVVLAARG